MPIAMDLSRISVLVIDDSSHMRTILRTILAGFGIRRVLEADNGVTGLAATRDYRPDIVLCDWLMLPRSGGDYMRALRRAPDQALAMTPVVVMSADTRKAVVIKALQLGIHEFLAKPISPSLMYERLERVLLENRPFVRKGAFFGPAPRASLISQTAQSGATTAAGGSGEASVFI